MKVKFPHSETAKEHLVKDTVGDWYILNTRPMNWSNDCQVAVRKSAVSVVEEVTYKFGQRFKVGSSQEEYILAQVADKQASLICLLDGNRWKPSLYVNDSYAITPDEMKAIIGNHLYTLIS